MTCTRFAWLSFLGVLFFSLCALPVPAQDSGVTGDGGGTVGTGDGTGTGDGDGGGHEEEEECLACKAEVTEYTAKADSFNFTINGVQADVDVCGEKNVIQPNFKLNLTFTVTFDSGETKEQLLLITAGNLSKTVGKTTGTIPIEGTVLASDDAVKTAGKAAAAAHPDNKGKVVTDAEPVGGKNVGIHVGGTVTCTNAAGDIVKGAGVITGPDGVLSLDNDGTAGEQTFKKS